MADAYYQVPNKSLGEFNITNDKVYTLTLNADLSDTNFGELAKLSEIPEATDTTTGGIRLYLVPEGGSGTIDSDSKKYAVLLDKETDNHYAYTYVPWIDTQYKVDEDFNYLCMYWDQEPTTTEGITTVGGVMRVGLSVVPVWILSGIGDMVNAGNDNRHAWYDNVHKDITDPLSAEIDKAITIAAQNLQTHAKENLTKFDQIDGTITSLSNTVHDNYYLKTETSNDVELNSAFTTLSSDFEKYLANTLKPGIRTNPAYLINETNAISSALSDEVARDYYKKALVYTKDETWPRTNLSTAHDLEDMFNTKQDNLTVNNNIATTKTYGNKDVATVSAIIDFVNSSLNKNTATYLGHFTSWENVPNDGSSKDPQGLTGYVSPTPDKNDYIYVDIQQGNPLKIKEGTWKFLMSSDKYDSKGQMIWDPTLGRNNWKPEFLLTDMIFTDALTKAINSGITSQLVDIFKEANQALNKLRTEYDNLTGRLRALAFKDSIQDNITGNGETGLVAVFNGNNTLTGMNFSPKKEKWTFELQDGTTKVQKYILVQNV